MRTHRKRFDLPPQPDLQFPLLWYIARKEGQIWVSDNRDQILQELAEIFDVPEEKLSETTRDGKDNRWWNHIRHVRRRLVEIDEINGRVHNNWSLTDSGWERIRKFLLRIISDFDGSALKNASELRRVHPRVVKAIIKEYREHHSDDFSL